MPFIPPGMTTSLSTRSTLSPRRSRFSASVAFSARALITELLDERSGDVGDLGVVLDHENGALSGHNGLGRRRLHGGLDRCRLPARQVDGDGSAAADRAGRNDGAARLMRKAVDLRQS